MQMTEQRLYWTGARRAPAQDRFFIDALDPDLWRAGDKENWDACWHTGMPAPEVFRAAGPGKWINHIPGNNVLTVKSMLYQTLAQARRRAPSRAMRQRLSFFPKSYLMPADYHALQRAAFAAPEKRWIVKPKRLSRGRGVSVCEDAGGVPLDAKWLIQEYLSDPHLYDGRKYVLRCYVLVRSIEPLRVYLYRDGFVKLASEPYRNGDFDNLYAHLTNPDVNALNQDAETPVVFVGFDDYRAWLEKNDHDADALFAKIRDIAVLTSVAAREAMREKTIRSGADAAACYELIGLDCMIDAGLRPWLLECNLSPSLDVCAAPETGGTHEAETKRALTRDLVCLLGLNAPAVMPHHDDEGAMIAAAEAEAARAGRFERIFPGPDAGGFLPFFPVPRQCDRALAAARAPLPEFLLAPHGVREEIFDDGLALSSLETGRMQTPDDAASFIWLKAAQGIPPDAIVEEMAALTEAGDATAAIRRKVWDILADWGAEGLLRPRAGEDGDEAAPPRAEPADAPRVATIAWAGKILRLEFAAPELAPRLEALLAPLRIADDRDAAPGYGVLRDTAGYAIAAPARLLKTGVRLSRLAGVLRDLLIDEAAAAHPGDPCLEAGLCETAGGGVLFAGGAQGGWDALALAFANAGGGAFCGGAARLCGAGEAAAIPVPARIGRNDLAAAAGGDRRPAAQEWDGGDRGYFLPCTVGKDNVGVRAVISPIRDDDAPGDAQARALGPRERLLALNRLRRPAGTRGGPQDATRLGAWARAIPVYEIRFADLAAAVGAVKTILQD